MHPLKAFILLSKPGIVSAEALAGIAGIFLTTVPHNPFESAVCGTICIVLAAVGAAMANSVIDRKTDIKMRRLVQRCQAFEALGTGKITTCSVVMILLSFLVAATFLNYPATLLLMAAVFAYLLIYTAWLKRSSPWGVFAGAIPGALPPIIGASAIAGSISTPSLLLAALIFVWQLPHFWFLALQYREEYRQAGIPVLPVSKGERITKSLIPACIILLLPLSLGLWALGFCSGVYALVALLSWVLLLAVSTDCLFRLPLPRKGYLTSIAYLLIIISAIIIDSYVRMSGNFPK